MRFEFFGQSAQDSDNEWANTARLLNCYRESVGDGEVVLKPVPGVEVFRPFGDGFCRALASVQGLLFNAQNGFLQGIDADGSRPILEEIPDSPITTISGNNQYVTVVAAGRYFVLPLDGGGPISEPETGAFDNFADVTFFGQLTVLIEDGRRVQWSGVADPLTLDGLAFATTEGRDDKNLRVLPIGPTLWIFKETCIERWQQNGANIEPIVGGLIEPGLLSRNLLVETPNGCFFVGSDNKAYIAQGGLRPISTIAVETSIANENPLSCVYYQDEGHEVCVISFEDRPSWCFDISTGEWHERPDFFVKSSAQAFGKFFVNRDGAGVFEVGNGHNDFSGQMTCRAIGRTIDNGGARFTVSRFQVRARVGRISRSEDLPLSAAVQANDGALQGAAGAVEATHAIPERDVAKIALRVSRATGTAFGPYKPRSLGNIGEYDQQLVWRALGRMKQFTPELSWSEGADVTVSAKAMVELA